MKYLKSLGLAFAYIIGSILIFTFIFTTLSYFNVIKDGIISIIKIIIPIISLLIGGYCIGKRSKKKGFLEGIKLGCIFSILLVIINVIFLNNSFKAKYLLFYIILIISAVLGSMIGINRKKG